MRDRVGRLLCRMGLHRWEQKDALDWDDDRSTPMCIVTTYAWCRRPACSQPTIAINREWVSLARMHKVG